VSHNTKLTRFAPTKGNQTTTFASSLRLETGAPGERWLNPAGLENSFASSSTSSYHTTNNGHNSIIGADSSRRLRKIRTPGGIRTPTL
jgi:hypothetical protein